MEFPQLVALQLPSLWRSSAFLESATPSTVNIIELIEQVPKDQNVVLRSNGKKGEEAKWKSLFESQDKASLVYLSCMPLTCWKLEDFLTSIKVRFSNFDSEFLGPFLRRKTVHFSPDISSECIRIWHKKTQTRQLCKLLIDIVDWFGWWKIHQITTQGNQIDVHRLCELQGLQKFPASDCGGTGFLTEATDW